MRPLLAVTRAEVEAYLGGLGQEWREDSSNRHLTLYAQPHPARIAAAARGLESAAARAPGADGRDRPRRRGMVAG